MKHSTNDKRIHWRSQRGQWVLSIPDCNPNDKVFAPTLNDVTKFTRNYRNFGMYINTTMRYW